MTLHLVSGHSTIEPVGRVVEPRFLVAVIAEAERDRLRILSPHRVISPRQVNEGGCCETHLIVHIPAGLGPPVASPMLPNDVARGCEDALEVLGVPVVVFVRLITNEDKALEWSTPLRRPRPGCDWRLAKNLPERFHGGRRL